MSSAFENVTRADWVVRENGPYRPALRAVDDAVSIFSVSVTHSRFSINPCEHVAAQEAQTFPPPAGRAAGHPAYADNSRATQRSMLRATAAKLAALVLVDSCTPAALHVVFARALRALQRVQTSMRTRSCTSSARSQTTRRTLSISLQLRRQAIHTRIYAPDAAAAAAFALATTPVTAIVVPNPFSKLLTGALGCLGVLQIVPTYVRSALESVRLSSCPVEKWSAGEQVASSMCLHALQRLARGRRGGHLGGLHGIAAVLVTAWEGSTLLIISVTK